jgi:hypothetical protein
MWPVVSQQIVNPQPYLPVGSVHGIDRFVYKLNPLYAKDNFPDLAKRKCNRRIKELQYVLSLPDGEPIIGLPDQVTTEKVQSFVLGDDTFDLSKE